MSDRMSNSPKVFNRPKSSQTRKTEKRQRLSSCDTEQEHGFRPSANQQTINDNIKTKSRKPDDEVVLVDKFFQFIATSIDLDKNRNRVRKSVGEVIDLGLDV